jgi:demethylmenaquinone methyltransferase/2-methoxy-6-polyprenyl-1,4-benzoquinol methylase
MPVDKSENRVRRMFGSIAPYYDFLNHLLSLNIDRYWRRRTVRLVPAMPGTPVLDVCTGTGDLALAYRRHSPYGTAIVGTDFCHEMLVRAAMKAASGSQGNGIRFIEADAQRLPFPDNYFGITTVAFGLRNVTDTDTGIAEMIRVTRPAGRIAILEFSRPRHWLLGRLYRAYFRYLLPWVGQLVSHSRDRAYGYLPQSVMEFPDGDALAARLSRHGLETVSWRPFTFGIATLYTGVKPAHSASS